MNASSPRKQLLFHAKTIVTIPIKSFPPETLDKAINLLSYGLRISKHFKSAKFFHHCFFYLLEDDPDYLQWLSHLKPYNRTRIDLKTIKHITDNPSFDSKIQKKFLKFPKLSRLLFISYDDLIEDKKVLILKFQREETKMLFWQGIQHLSMKAIEKEGKFGDVRKILAQKLFLKADKDGNKTLDFDEVRKILRQLRIEINNEYLVKFFEKYDKDRNKTIDWTEFQEIIDDISLKPELKPVFKKYCLEAKNLKEDDPLFNNAQMEFKEFAEFLKKEQKQDLSELEFRKLLGMIHSDFTKNILAESRKSMSYCEDRDGRKRLAINFSEFCSIIFSRNNEIFEPSKLEVYQDMSRPLTDYFINSSHNTYLLANQLTGESSTKAYINAFAKGCRCVELDCWEGDKGEPIIYHGYTFTSKIMFRDVVQTIKDYAFVSSPYPVILSLENHCKQKQQDKIAEILEEILGDSIYVLPENFCEIDKFPSPEELKYRILVKDKASLPSYSVPKLSLFDEKRSLMVPLDCEDDDRHLQSKEYNLNLLRYVDEQCSTQRRFLESFSIEKSCIVASIPIDCSLNKFMAFYAPRETLKSNNPKVSFSETLSAKSPKKGSMNNFTESSGGGTEKSTKKAISLRLKGMLCLFGIKMDLNANRSIWNISSIKEPTFEKLSKEHEDKLQEFLQNNFLRVYPSGTRVDSSNYDPIDCFNFGVQMTALNVQTADLPLLLYMSKFQENGGIYCGYVLKPDHLLSETAKLLRRFNKIRKIICIEVISGQQLRPENEENFTDLVDPYLEVSFRGISIDEKENNKVFKSHIITNNGFNPRFDLYCQFKLHCPEMGMVVFKVFGQEIAKKDMKIGWNAIGTECLRAGFRTLPLLNSSLNPIEFSYLLCKIEILDVVNGNQ